MDPNESQSEAFSSLCSFCQTLAKELSTHPLTSTWNQLARDGTRERTYKSCTTVLEIMKTASDCYICRFIVSSLVWVNDGTFVHQETIESYFAASRQDSSESTAIKPVKVYLRLHTSKIAQCALHIPLLNGEHAEFRLDITADEGIPSHILRHPVF